MSAPAVARGWRRRGEPAIVVKRVAGQLHCSPAGLRLVRSPQAEEAFPNTAVTDLIVVAVDRICLSPRTCSGQSSPYLRDVARPPLTHGLGCLSESRQLRLDPKYSQARLAAYAAVEWMAPLAGIHDGPQGCLRLPPRRSRRSRPMLSGRLGYFGHESRGRAGPVSRALRRP
jgi:hypothetical protein